MYGCKIRLDILQNKKNVIMLETIKINITPTLGRQPLTQEAMNFIIYVEAFMEIINMHLRLPHICGSKKVF